MNLEEERSKALSEEEWYKALYEEDSKRLVELLEEPSNADLQLWKQGWQSDRRRLVIGRPGNYWEKEEWISWMGRTALHVAARRGCVVLLETTLQLCKRNIKSQDPLEDILLVKDGHYGLDAIAMAMVNGNPDIITRLLEAEMGCKSDQYGVRITKSINSQVTEEEMEMNIQVGLYHTELVDITKGVIHRYKGRSQVQESPRDGYEALFEELLLHRYDWHRDFNFCPQDEYLFHFLFIGCGAAEATWLKRHTRTLRDYSEDKISFLAGRINELVLTEIVKEASMSSLDGFLEFLWARQDGQGRPPFHIAVQTEEDPFFLRGKVLTLTRVTVPNETLKNIIHTRDGAGRTAVHRAVALGDPNKTVGTLLSVEAQIKTIYDLDGAGSDEDLTDHLRELATEYPINRYDNERKCVVAKAFEDCLREREFDADSRSLWKSGRGIEYRIDLGRLSKSNGLSESIWSHCAPIHSAILHNLVNVVKEFSSKTKGKQDPSREVDHPSKFQFKNEVLFVQAGTEGKPTTQIWNLEDMAVFRGDVEDASTTLTHVGNIEGYKPRPLSAAAGLGRYDLLQLLINNGHDPVKEEIDGESPLHSAVKETTVRTEDLRSGIDLCGFVTCAQILKWKEKNINDMARRSKIEHDTPEWDVSDKAIVERQACISLLLKEGCDVFKTDKDGKIPYPNRDANSKFVSWWHEQETTAFAVAQNAQSGAANAIGVTAALVATSSIYFPLNFAVGFNHNSEFQSGNRALQVFRICNDLKFYFGIGSIIAALVTNLPMPQRSMTQELLRTRKMVNVGLLLFFPSIICYLVATLASFISVIQTYDFGWHWSGGGLTIYTFLVGGLVCLIMVGIVANRLATFIGHKKKWRRTFLQNYIFED